MPICSVNTTRLNAIIPEMVRFPPRSHHYPRNLMQHDNVSFDDVNIALLNINAMTETAEAHGTLCGMACISGTTCIDSWLTIVLEGQDSNNLQLHETRQILTNLYNNTYEKLTSSNYSLEVFVHNDDTALDIRVEDLSLWCQGFLYGLSAAGLSDINKLPVDASEILQDMSDISKAGYEQEDDEESEAAFAEILEYIRIGAYVIFNTFNNDDTLPNKNTVH